MNLDVLSTEAQMLVKEGRTWLLIQFQDLELAIKIPGIRSWRGWFEGMYRNWCEFTFFACTRHAFCVPTYISFFGLLNIQRCGKDFEDYMDWSRVFTAHLAQLIGTTYGGRHHWASVGNFVRVDNKLRMRNYGSRAARKDLIRMRKQLEML